VEAPASGTRAEKASSMTQALADAFATGIADHPEDWHMLQRLWLKDLDPARDPARKAREDVPRVGADDADPHGVSSRAASSSTSVTWPSTSSAWATRSPCSPPPTTTPRSRRTSSRPAARYRCRTTAPWPG